MIDNEWTDVAPKAIGSYYFYGDISFKKGNPNFKPELSIMHVYPISSGVMHVVAGQFFYPESKNWQGKFKNLSVELPDL